MEGEESGFGKIVELSVCLMCSNFTFRKKEREDIMRVMTPLPVNNMIV